MTVVTLGTSQPQCISPQGPIQGVSVSSQRKGEVNGIKNMQCVCSIKTLWNRIQHRLLPPLHPSHSDQYLQSSMSATAAENLGLHEGLQHHPPCKTRKRGMVNYWYDGLCADVRFIMQLTKKKKKLATLQMSRSFHYELRVWTSREDK